MGNVIDLAERREARRKAAEAIRIAANDSLSRLDHAVAELEEFIRDPHTRRGRIGTVVETELGTIRRTVSEGSIDEAAERAERLAARLAHASARSS
ncbi:MAG: hypothetical protein WD004_08525 [Actinomycetota bacterium]